MLASYSDQQNTPNGCVLQNTFSFVLPIEMTIDVIESVAAEMKQLSLSEKSSLLLDGKQLENITTPGLQLIVSLEKTLTGQGGSLTLKNLKKPIIQIFKDSGLENMLGTQE